jgi:hypothetical protein
MNEIVLSSSDCNYVKSFWNDEISLDGAGRGLHKISDDVEISFKRNVKGHYIDFKSDILISFLLEKLKVIKIKSITTGGVKLAKYVQGDYFLPHRDFNYYGSGALYKTLVIQLTNPSDYLGGDFYVENIPQTRIQGGYSLFLSSKEHEVKVIENGTRYSLVLFLLEEDFDIPKKLT